MRFVAPQDLHRRRMERAILSLYQQLRGLYLLEALDGELDIVARVGGGYLDADARLTLRYHRVRERDHVDSLRQHRVGHFDGGRGVADHDRNDRVLAGQD